MRRIFAFFLSTLLAACNIPRPTAVPMTVRDTPTNQPCYFNWATQPLPDLSKQVQAAMDSADLKGITATAEAFGENCYDNQTNQPVSFSAIETDFRITMKVASLEDKDELGNLLEKILTILDKFPIGSLPGSQPGYLFVTFRSGDQEMHLSFLMENGKAAREKGLYGAALLEELQKK